MLLPRNRGGSHKSDHKSDLRKHNILHVYMWCRALVTLNHPLVTSTLARIHYTTVGVPTIPKTVLERGSNLLKELDAPSSVAEFDNVQAKLESDTKKTGKMEGGCLREFTRFLEKEVHTPTNPCRRLYSSWNHGCSVSLRIRNTRGRIYNARCSPRVSRCGAVRAVSASSTRIRKRPGDPQRSEAAGASA